MDGHKTFPKALESEMYCELFKIQIKTLILSLDNNIQTSNKAASLVLLPSKSIYSASSQDGMCAQEHKHKEPHVQHIANICDSVVQSNS